MLAREVRTHARRHSTGVCVRVLGPPCRRMPSFWQICCSMLPSGLAAQLERFLGDHDPETLAPLKEAGADSIDVSPDRERAGRSLLLRSTGKLEAQQRDVKMQVEGVVRRIDDAQTQQAFAADSWEAAAAELKEGLTETAKKKSLLFRPLTKLLGPVQDALFLHAVMPMRRCALGCHLLRHAGNFNRAFGNVSSHNIHALSHALLRVRLTICVQVNRSAVMGGPVCHVVVVRHDLCDILDTRGGSNGVHFVRDCLLCREGAGICCIRPMDVLRRSPFGQTRIRTGEGGDAVCFPEPTRAEKALAGASRQSRACAAQAGYRSRWRW